MSAVLKPSRAPLDRPREDERVEADVFWTERLGNMQDYVLGLWREKLAAYRSDPAKAPTEACTLVHLVEIDPTRSHGLYPKEFFFCVPNATIELEFRATLLVAHDNRCEVMQSLNLGWRGGCHDVHLPPGFSPKSISVAHPVSAYSHLVQITARLDEWIEAQYHATYVESGSVMPSELLRRGERYDRKEPSPPMVLSHYCRFTVVLPKAEKDVDEERRRKVANNAEK